MSRRLLFAMPLLLVAPGGCGGRPAVHPAGGQDRSGVDWLVRSRTTGKLAIAQVPNIPLWVFLAATAVRLALHPTGSSGTAVSVVGTAALVWWAADEIFRGESPFRRFLGAVVLMGVVVGLLTR